MATFWSPTACAAVGRATAQVFGTNPHFEFPPWTAPAVAMRITGVILSAFSKVGTWRCAWNSAHGSPPKWRSRSAGAPTCRCAGNSPAGTPTCLVQPLALPCENWRRCPLHPLCENDQRPANCFGPIGGGSDPLVSISFTERGNPGREGGHSSGRATVRRGNQIHPHNGGHEDHLPNTFGGRVSLLIPTWGSSLSVPPKPW